METLDKSTPPPWSERLKGLQLRSDKGEATTPTDDELNKIGAELETAQTRPDVRSLSQVIVMGNALEAWALMSILRLPDLPDAVKELLAQGALTSILDPSKPIKNPCDVSKVSCVREFSLEQLRDGYVSLTEDVVGRLNQEITVRAAEAKAAKAPDLQVLPGGAETAEKNEEGSSKSD